MTVNAKAQVTSTCQL